MALIRSYGAELPEGPFSPLPRKHVDKSLDTDVRSDLNNAARDAESWAEWHKREADLLQSAAKELENLGDGMVNHKKLEKQERELETILEKKRRQLRQVVSSSLVQN